MLCLSQGCHSSMHLWSIDHKFFHILWWHCIAPASRNLHLVEPRWPFYLSHCQWRAGICSGSANDMLCWPAWLVCSCMPASISASWWSKYLSISTDLLAYSMALTLQQWWLLLPFWSCRNLWVLKIHDPIVFPVNLTLLLIRNCKRKQALTQNKERKLKKI